MNSSITKHYGCKQVKQCGPIGKQTPSLVYQGFSCVRNMNCCFTHFVATFLIQWCPGSLLHCMKCITMQTLHLLFQKSYHPTHEWSSVRWVSGWVSWRDVDSDWVIPTAGQWAAGKAWHCLLLCLHSGIYDGWWRHPVPALRFSARGLHLDICGSVHRLDGINSWRILNSKQQEILPRQDKECWRRGQDCLWE